MQLVQDDVFPGGEWGRDLAPPGRIALDDDAFALRQYTRDIGFALPVLLATSSQLPPEVRPARLPQTLALDSAGGVLRRVIGARDWDRRDAQLELLAGTAAG